MNGGNVRKVVPLAGLLGLAAAVAACDLIPGTGPNDLDQYQFFSEVTLPEFEHLVQEGSARVEIVLSTTVAALSEDALVAREIEVRGGAALEDEEEIVGRIADLDADNGILVLELGDMRVEFDEETTFRKGDATWELGQFIGHVTEALTFDETAMIKAERAPRDVPQAPDDSTFVALRISLISAEHAPEIDVNIDLDNLLISDSPPPDGWVHVLGRMIELRMSEDITQLHSERDDLEKKEFGGKVKTANASAGTFELADGTVIRIVDDTKFAYESGDQHRLGSLEAVAAALDDGLQVWSAGCGVVERHDPLTIVAMHVVFEVEDPSKKSYEGVVTSVDENTGLVTLSNDIVIRITDETEIKQNPEDDRYLTSVGAVAEAWRADQKVVAWGEGVVESEDPLTIRAVCAVFKLALPAVEGFEGEVSDVDVDAGSVTLSNGTVVYVTDTTVIKYEEGDTHRLPSLQAVSDALSADTPVYTGGEGIVKQKDPLKLEALHIVFEI
ncbi:MAG: hypothetical protein JSW71_19620 [Gemmatimonadota bacterium]|nr:MAG: hypothetical protein JSW71_19620 [Gemmatimonadota bacterium]